MFAFVCLFSVVGKSVNLSDFSNFVVVVVVVFSFVWKHGSMRSLQLIMFCYVQCGTVCAHHDACHTTHAIRNPWTASKSDRATKMIVTLLFNDGFQKFKNSFKADEIFLGK